MASQAAQPGVGNSAGGGRLAQFKLVLLGESAVGKSSLVNRFVQGHFSGFQEPTYGSSYKMENIVAEYCTQTVVLMTQPSNLKFGTQPFKSVTTVWPDRLGILAQCTIVALKLPL